MADVETLRRLREQVADSYLSDEVVGMNALCVLGGWRWEGGTSLIGPCGPVPEANRGLPDRSDNPAISLDAVTALAELVCPREWPGIMRKGLGDLSQRHHWHTTFPRPGQRETLARAVLLVLVAELLGEAIASADRGASVNAGTR